MSHYNLVHKSHPDATSNENTGCKRQQWLKKWNKIQTVPAWDLGKVKSKNEVILEAQRDKKKVHNAQLEPKLQKYTGRVVLRGDIVKDDSGTCAVFTEQGSSARQMTVAKIMDVIARLPGCDAVSAYTQVKLEDAPGLLNIPNTVCPDVWIRLPRHKWPKSWESIEDPVVPLERNWYGHPLAGLL